MRETHISWVFVGADRAYKLKKPVVLPFLDYGTPARRRAMCRAEVALNRRLAPDVYLGVRSLLPAPDGRLELGEEDDPAAVEYAVEMRRYSEADTLAARLATGTAGRDAIASVGARLARFHADAPPDVRVDGAEAVKRPLDDNFATLRRLLLDPSQRAAIARAERFAAAFLTRVWDELDARAAAGLVRDGHGDLRLEHILLEREIAVVDCVEFDPALRRIDVGSDLAFLVMELHEAGHSGLAAVLVKAYRDAGGEPGSDSLLAFFAAYRAQVRAKIALTRASQFEPGSGEPARRRTRAVGLLRLAERLHWSARAPLVIAVAGLSASGKSTLARRLASVSGYLHLNSDVVRKDRAGLPATARAPVALYDAAAGLAVYSELGRRARQDARQGVIVDATFRRLSDRAAFLDGLGEGQPLLVVECRAPVEVLETRARAREGDPDRVSDAGVAIVRRQLREAEPLDEIAARDHMVLRSDRPVEQIVAAVADAVDGRNLNP